MKKNHTPIIEPVYWWFRASGSSGWTVTHYRIAGREHTLCGIKVATFFKWGRDQKRHKLTLGKSPTRGHCLRCAKEKDWKENGGGYSLEKTP